jgi:predicted Rossmann fold nucleotide-binding protein DprA/Smf involved in DNA uptake
VIEDLAAQIVETAAAVAAARSGHARPDDRPALPLENAPPAGAGASGLSADERSILGSLPRTGGIGAEELVAASGLPAGRLMAALLGLELQGLVRALPGRRFMRSG